MPILNGSLSARVWRVIEALPPNFTEGLAVGLKRHGFRPIDLDKGHVRSMGWVNIRQVLDARLTPAKALFGGTLALALRVDRVAINQRLFRATLAQQIARALREKGSKKLSGQERAALEDQVRMDLLRRQSPSMAIHEMAWNLENGLIFFGATGDKLNVEFSELFTQTFNLSIEPQFPYLRAQKWAQRQKAERELLELLPSPFSPRAPAEVFDMSADSREGE